MAIYRKLTVANKSIIHIDYTKGSNAQNIEFEFVDYTIPAGARAFFYVRKPSGLIVYNQEEISGQKVIVKPTLQMTAEGGTNGATLAIMDGEKVLASFPIVFEIAQSYIDPEAVESTNEFDLVTQEVADAIAAAERAAGSVTEAAAEAKKAAGYSTQAQEQADRAEAAANESAGAATAAIEARLGTKEDGTYIKADNSVAQDLKELDGGLSSVSQNLTHKVLTGTMPAKGETVKFNYPDGFTYNNTYIAMACIQTSNGAWTNGQTTYNIGSGSEIKDILVISIQYALRQDTIDIICRDKNVEGRPFEIVIGQYK